MVKEKTIMKRFLKTLPIWVLIGIIITLFGLFFAFIPNALNFNHYSKHWAKFVDEADPNTNNFFIPSIEEILHLFREHTWYSLCATLILIVFLLFTIKYYQWQKENRWQKNYKFSRDPKSNKK